MRCAPVKSSRPAAVAVALLLALLCLFGCQQGRGDDVSLPSLSIRGEETLYLEVGDSYQLTTDAPDGVDLTWSSSSPCVGITQEGLIVAQATGTATITVTYGTHTDSITVEVVLYRPAPGTQEPLETTPSGGDDPAESTDGDVSSGGPSADTDPPETPPAETAPPTVVLEVERAPEGYTPAASHEEALERTQRGELSGYPHVPDQAPILSEYRPMKDGQYVKNVEAYYADENTYVVVDAYGREVFRVYRGGAYISLEEVAAYVYAFGDVPANYAGDKKTKPTASIWGINLRLNHSKFSGNTSKYPYEPALPRISGCGGDLTYYEIDIGTTGTDCDPSYRAALYNNGSSITRGAARIVYARFDANGNKIIEAEEKFVFYTYNHYNDFREYLNYYGGWGEMFGNITGGGTISSNTHYNPTPYVPSVNAPLSTTGGARMLSMVSALPTQNSAWETADLDLLRRRRAA